jgi:hypothetical protein
MLRGFLSVALAVAWMFVTHAPALAAVAAPAAESCCCSDSCTPDIPTDSCPVAPLPVRSACGCVVVCAPLPPVNLPTGCDFWLNPGISRERSLLRDAEDPGTRRAKPLLPPPKSPV